MKSFSPNLFTLLIIFAICLNPVAIPLTKERNFHENAPLPSNSESWYYITKNLDTTKLATDLNDDIIVVGKDWYDNIILFKLNSSGSLLFEKNLTLNLDFAYYYISEISVDSYNCIYVTGVFFSVNSERDLFLIKFDVLGNMLWIRTWGGDENEYVYGMSVDTNDNIYISGHTSSYSVFGVWNIFLVKYNNTGNFKWAQVWGSNTTNSNCYALATDSNDNIYITGYVSNNSDIKGCLIKYNCSGALQWNITLNSELRDVVVDLQNNIYSIARGPSYSQLTILKYNPEGTEVWNNSYTINDYFSSSIALDPSGNIYIGGSVYLYSVPDIYDMFIMKCNNSGSFQWHIQFGTYYYENFRGITCDSLGNVYLLSESRNNDHFIVLFKNPTNGLKLFQQTINGYIIILFCSVIIISMTSIMLLIVKFKKSQY